MPPTAISKTEAARPGRILEHTLGEGSSLALLQQHDAKQFAEHVEENRDHLEAWLPWAARVRDEATAVEFIERFLMKLAKADGLMLGIWSNGSLAGGVLLRQIDWQSRSTEIGYWLGAAHLGRGLATRAATAVMTHAFRELRLNRIQLQAPVTNLSSRAVAERLGFREEGIIRAGGTYPSGILDHALYSLLADEWQGSRLE